MSRIFITGIGTGVGKTIVSAVVTEALKADYWKPIQTGMEEGTDSDIVRKLISNSLTKIHKEAFCLPLPVSPHTAAEAAKVQIRIKDMVMPATNNALVIEGAGGLMVPLNERELMIDLIQKTVAPVVLVVQHYLGSINHTLLSLEALKHRKIKLAGIIYNGEANPSSEKVIENFGNCKVIGRIGREERFTPSTISNYAKKMEEALKAIIQH